MDILIGTNNKGKLREYRQIFAGLPIRFYSLSELGLVLDVEETGGTFVENAILKARAFAAAADMVALADDTGLCVHALNGAPGLHSARYGGAGLDDAGRRRLLLSEMHSIPDEARTAHFETVLALAFPDSPRIITVRGAVYGRILREERGNNGFGYDPIFVPKGYDRTFAELSPDEKDRISHRGRAARKLVPILEDLLAGVV